MPQDRRQFLTTALTAAPLFVPRSAWGANDRLAYGLIGSGGRGRYLQGNFQKLGAECVAIAEVYEPNLQNALKTTPDAKKYVDYHDLLAQTGHRCGGGGDARSSARALSVRRARREEGRVPGKADVALDRGEPADDPGGAQDRPDRADRDAAAQRSGGDQGQGGLRQRHTGQGDDGQADVELERLQAAGQFAAARQAGLEALPGQGEGARSGADAVPQLALLLGLFGRQHDGPGHASDGRGAVVHAARASPNRR